VNLYRFHSSPKSLHGFDLPSSTTEQSQTLEAALQDNVDDLDLLASGVVTRHYLEGRLHRPDGPAYVQKYETALGKARSVETWSWFWGGQYWGSIQINDGRVINTIFDQRERRTWPFGGKPPRRGERV
jgi:hypothetical protein